VHDQDAKAMKAVRAAGSDVPELLDPNHVIKGLIGPFFDKCNAPVPMPAETSAKTGRPKAAKSVAALTQIRVDLVKRLRWILRTNFTTEERLAEWDRTVEHFTADDSPWKLKKNPQATAQLQMYVEGVAGKLPDIQYQFNTNFNESFFANLALRCHNGKNHPVTFRVMFAITVMSIDDGIDWPLPSTGMSWVSMS
jgi:hypothetical protein